MENKTTLFSPFGPKFIISTLEDNIRLKLLDCVNQMRQADDKILRPVFQIEGIGLAPGSAQNASISEGEMIVVERTSQEKYGNIVANTMTNLIKLYAEKYYREFVGAEEESIKYEYVPTDCWYVVMKAGDFHKLHAHKRDADFLSVGQVSGAIYLDVPKDLPFPQGVIEWVLSARDENLASYSLEWSPKSGDVFVWPSWVKHTVYPFRGNGERIMISFNGCWRNKGTGKEREENRRYGQARQ